MKWQVIKNRVRRGLRRIVVYGIYLTVVFLLVSFILFQIPAVQEGLAARYLRDLRNVIGFDITAGSLYLTWYDRLVIHDLLIKDPEGNAMISASTVSINFRIGSLTQDNAFNIDGAGIDSARVYLVNIQESDTSRNLNMNVFINRINSMSAGSGGKTPLVNIGEIALQRSHFTYNDNDSDSIKYGFDYRHFAVDLDDGELTQFKVIGDTIQFNVNSLLALDRTTGLDVKNLQTFFRISQGGLEFHKLHAEAGNSIINDSIVFTYKSLRDLNDFNNKVSMVARLRETRLDPHDLSLFAPGAEKIGQPVYLSGNLSGRVKRLSYRNMKVRFGHTEVEGRLEMDGLPAFNETFIRLSLSKGTIDVNDLAFAFPAPVYSRLKPLGKFLLTGTFTGFVNDFVANADLNSPMGIVRSNVNLKVDERNFDNSLYHGTIVMTDFHLGEYLSDTTLLQRVSLSGTVNGKGLTYSTANLLLVGNVQSIGVRGYNYTNIKTDARFASQFFSGDLTINDPNLKFKAEGSIDFRKGTNLVKIKATLDTAFLDKVKISSKPLFVRSYIDINSRGLHIDSLFGDALLRDTKIVYNEKTLELDSIHVYSALNADERSITVRSSLFDASLKGNYYNSTLFTDIGKFYEEFLLSIRNNKEALAAYYSDKRRGGLTYDANFNMVIHDLSPIADLTNLDLAISDGTVVDGRFSNSLTSIFQLFSSIDTLVYGGKMFLGNEFEFTGSKIRDSANVLAMVTARSAQQRFTSAFETKDLLLEGIWNMDHVEVGLDLDQIRMNNSVRLRAEVDFLSDSTRIRILPSNIRVLDKQWQADPRNMILFRGKEISVSNLELHNDSTSVMIDGAISRDATLPVTLAVNNLALDLLDNFSSEHFEGAMNGTITAKNLYDTPEFQSDMRVKEFKINDLLIGDITGISLWNPDTRKFDIDLSIDRHGERTIDIAGTYDPSVSENPLDAEARFKDARLHILGPLMRGLFSEIDGELTGSYAIRGTVLHPAITGVGNIKGGQMKVDYLGTLYYFEGGMGMTPNQFVFENWDVTDVMGNKGTIRGYVAHKNFGKFTINLDGKFTDFQVLNTTARDNDLFYGQGFATGDLNIFGPSSNLKISATARTEANSKLFIPISGTSEVDKKDFITFSHFTDSLAFHGATTESRRRELSGVALELNLEITPAAYAEIIFDIKAGDIIRGRGNGDILIQMDTKGEFNMFGGIQFTEGAYNFTLYDLINKEFSIKPGSRLTWYGDPYQGIMNVTASYRQLTSLAPMYDKDPDLQAEPAIKRKYPVEVLLKLEGAMLSPLISFDLVANDLPNNVSVEGRGPVRLAFDFDAFKARLDEQELKRQVFSLIILRRLSPLDAFSTNGSLSLANSVSELLSNQLSYWLTQVDQNLEIDLDLGALDAEAFNTFQLRLSYSFLNGRLRITRDGTFTSQNEQQQSVAAIVGDWTVDYLLTPDGKFKVKMYSRSNFNAVSSSLGGQTAMTTGVSLLHTQNFNEVKDLLRGARERRRQEALKEEDDSADQDGGN
jgi:hypothetical protein